MSSQAIAKEPRFYIDDFMTLFICALVVRGKEYIYLRRGERADEELRRMRALHKHLEKIVDAKDFDAQSVEWRRFLVSVRNQLSPSPIGSFDGFRHQFVLKVLTLVDLDWGTGEYYKLTVSAVTAKCYLEQGDPRIREFAEKAAEVYMSDLTGKR